jgi:DNA polymerase III subunit gamma/tau
MTNRKEALYRHYRPKTFEEVMGQDHILKALQGVVEQNLVSHAYLFHGGRGTGKTSIARIFARELGTDDSDLYEIDAASHTSIENIKELNESVHTLPFQSTYKVYILDEVHMLSKAAWNAFLKTLEEPPAYVIFMATTEIEKVPDTILSRCQVFSFKKPNKKMLKEVIEAAAKIEGYKLEEGVSELIALVGDGSFRDAYGTLEKAISVSKDKKISLAEAEAVTGAPKEEMIMGVLEAIAYKKKDDVLETFSKATDQGMDPELFAELLLERLRMLLLIKIKARTVETLKKDLADSTYERLEKLGNDPESKLGSETLLRLIDARQKMARSSMSELILELCLIDLVK